jgi:hypothetical protein
VATKATDIVKDGKRIENLSWRYVMPPFMSWDES